MLKVEYRMGGYTGSDEFPDGATEAEVEDAFQTWLSNRSDLGWHVVEGELTEDKPPIS